MMVVDITTTPTVKVGKPRRLFGGRYSHTLAGAFWPDYDVTPDGQRFLMVKSSETSELPNHVNVVLNWFDELKRLVPLTPPAPSGK